MTWRQLVRLVKRKYGLKELIWIRNKNYIWGGECDYTVGSIKLSYKQSGGAKNFENRICTLFHELGHIYCFNNRIWKGYHYSSDTLLTEPEKKLIIRTGLKAERWVDKWAAKEMKKYFPKIVYPYKYFDKKRVKEVYDKEYLSIFR